MSQKKEFAIVTSLNKKDRDSFFRFYLSLIFYTVKYTFYMLIFDKRGLAKYKTKFIFAFQSKQHKVIGHRAVVLSLIRGFDELKIPYTYNKITKDTKYIVLAWTCDNDLDILEKLKEKISYEKVMTVPVVRNFDTYKIAQKKFVNIFTVASEKVKEHYTKILPQEDVHKIVVWPSGVKLPKISSKNSDNKIKSGCVLYTKHIPIDTHITNLLEEYNIKYDNIHYDNSNNTSYYFSEWTDSLKRRDFAIFHQNITESQGLAMAEAWSYNVPTIIKYNVDEQNRLTCPYFDPKVGLYYKDYDELEEILKEYIKNPQKFLSQFSPREYCENNFSDRKSVEALIKIIKSN